MIMGFLDKIKGWLNIGGVKVRIDGVEPKIAVGHNTLSGKALLTSKTDKDVLGIVCKVVNEQTRKDDGEEATEEFIVGERNFPEPFAIKAGETREIDFSIDYFIDQQLKHKGGVMGAVGKLGAFASGEKDSYSLVVECDVKGTVLDPSARVDLKLSKS
jgi:hypothetical protein